MHRLDDQLRKIPALSVFFFLSLFLLSVFVQTALRLHGYRSAHASLLPYGASFASSASSRAKSERVHCQRMTDIRS